LECTDASKSIDADNEIEVDLSSGIINNITKNETYQAQPLPDFAREMVAKGGLINVTREKMAK
jgi:3-isopropylmalate/(R)-2-methylmalate dehydratase small subunit